MTDAAHTALASRVAGKCVTKRALWLKGRSHVGSSVGLLQIGRIVTLVSFRPRIAAAPRATMNGIEHGTQCITKWEKQEISDEPSRKIAVSKPERPSQATLVETPATRKKFRLSRSSCGRGFKPVLVLR
jgi:hypothetical protein